jgi:hypothetical protein
MVDVGESSAGNRARVVVTGFDTLSRSSQERPRSVATGYLCQSGLARVEDTINQHSTVCGIVAKGLIELEDRAGRVDAIQLDATQLEIGYHYLGDTTSRAADQQRSFARATATGRIAADSSRLSPVSKQPESVSNWICKRIK